MSRIDEKGRPLDLESGEAWADFCERLKVVGQRILQDDFPADPHDRAEGFRHLSRLAVFALQWSVDFSDPLFPALYRYDDDVIKWGGPNSDNNYQRARIDPKQTYRITGNVTSLRELIISTPEGDMQLGQLGVFEEHNLSQLKVGTHGELEVTLSAAPHPGNWIPLHPRADHVCIRQYVSDWDRDRVAQLRIERVGSEGRAPDRLQPERMAIALDQAATWVERTVVFWKDFMSRARAFLPDNQMSPPRAQPGGAADVLYGGGFWNLAEDEALLIECQPPTARYYSIQLYSYPWFESLDFGNRVNSLSGHQLQIDDDGRFRVVVAHQDPAVANWLDTEGRREGLVTYRWVFSSTAPAPTARVLELDQLRTQLPAGARPFSPEERHAQIGRRQAATARRFRT